MTTIRTWWGQLFINALENFTDPGRLARGRSYANPNRIKSWSLKNAEMSAKIRGNINAYFGVYKEPTYTTTITLKPIAHQEWDLLIQHLGSRAGYVSRLLLNEMPDNIEKPFESLGLHLLPANSQDFITDCSCPDYENPCKHVAGLSYFLAAQLDQDPFLLFALRGLPQEQLLKKLKQTPLGKALAESKEQEQGSEFMLVDRYFTRPQSLELSTCDYQAFWTSAKRIPETIKPVQSPNIPALLVRKGGDFPEFWKLSLTFPEAMATVYEAIKKKNKAW